MSIHRLLCLAIVLLMPTVAARAENASPNALEEEARSIIANPFAARADLEGQTRFFLDWARQHPQSPLAEAALRLALGTDRTLLTHPAVGEDEARQILASAPRNPRLRDMATAYLARSLASRGMHQEARTLHRQRGLVPRWRVAGPFGHFRLASFYETFAPEREIDLEGEMPGTTGPVRWHLIEAERALPVVDPWEMLAVDGGVVYLLGRFRSETATPAEIHLRTHAAAAVFLNGRAIGLRDPYEAFTSAEMSLPVRLDAGWNVLLLRLGAPDAGPATVEARLLGPDGAPLDLGWTADPAPESVAGNEEAGSGATADSPGGARPRLPSEIRAAVSDETPHLRAILAAILLDLGLTDEAVRQIERAAAIVPDNAWIQVLNARIHSAAPHLTPARRESASLAAFRAALEARPDFAPALLGLAGSAAERDRPAEALAFIERVLEADPRCLEALSARIEIAVGHDWFAEAEAWTRAALDAHPDSIRILESATLYGRHFTRPLFLLDTLRHATEVDASRIDLQQRLARTLAHLGRPEEAATVLRRVREIRPDDPTPQRLTGELALSTGDWTTAETAFREALSRLPADATLHRWLGDALFRQGRTEDAVAAYRASLARRPDQHELRRLVARLSGETYAFWEAYAVDPEAKLRSAALRTARGSTARVIDQTVLTIYPDGSYANYTHSLQAVLSPHGKHDAGLLPLYGELIEARTLVPVRGEWVTVEPVRVPGQRQLTMPAVAPGTAVEYQYLQTSGTPFDHSLRFPKWYFRSPDTEEEFLFSQYVIRAPQSLPIAYAARNLTQNIEFNSTIDGDWAVYTWTAREMESAPKEEGMPHIDEILPFIDISGRRSWQDINRILMNITIGRTRVTADIQRIVREVTDGATTPKETVKRLHAFVCREIEEVGETSGTAQRILERRAGSRRILLMALLQAAGFDPSYVAVRPPEEILFPPNWSIPQTSHLPEAVVLVALPEGERLWLDTRYRSIGAGETLEDMSGATAFIISAEGGTFDTIPPVPPARFAREEERSLRPDPDSDTVAVDGRLLVRGREGQEHKELALRVDERLRRTALEDFLGRSLPGVTTGRISLPALDENGRPFEVRYEATVPDFLHRRQDGRAIDLGLTPLPLLPQGPADPSERETPYHLDRYIVGEDRFTVLLPESAGEVRLPEEVVLRHRYGLYQLRARRTAEGVEIRRQYRFTPQRIPLQDWPTFVALARDIERAEAQSVSWRMPAPETAPETAAPAPAGAVPAGSP